MKSADPSKQLFDEFSDGEYDRLLKCINEDHSEDVRLDFKESQSKDGELSRDERAVLGKISSAFANTYGGVIVLGVQAKNNIPNALSPIPNIGKFQKTVADALGKIVSPTLTTDMTRIDDPNDVGRGFLVIHVPEGNPKPYQSGVDHRYYIRAGSNSVVAEAPIVRGLFFSGAVTSVELAFEGASIRPNEAGAQAMADHRHMRGDFKASTRNCDLSATLVLRNLGGTTIRGCAIAVPTMDRFRFTADHRLFLGHASAIRTALAQGGPALDTQVFVLKPEVELYPKTERVIGKVTMAPPTTGDLYEGMAFGMNYALFIESVAEYGIANGFAVGMNEYDHDDED